MVEIPYLSVCSGIEAFSVAVEPMPEFVPAAFAEIEDFPSKVLAYRFPNVPNLGDMTKIDTTRLGHIGWLVGGTPCQSFSVAGLRGGLSDERGNLTLEFVRLAHALAEANGLRGLLWENVPGVLNHADNPFGCFLAGIVGHDAPLVTPDGARWPDAGMVAGPRARAAWRVLDSQHFGVAQRRSRVFVVADFTGGFDPATVLFEPRGKRRRAAPGGKAGEAVAGTLGGSSQSGGFRTTDLDNSGAFVVGVAPTLRAGGNNTGGDRPPGSDVDTVESLVVTHTLKAEGHDASEDGTGRGVPMVVYAGNAEGGNPDLPSLNASNGKKGVNNQTALVSVFDPNQITSKTNRSVPKPGISHTLPATSNAPIAFNSKDHGQDAGELAPTLRSAGHSGSHAKGGAPPAVMFSITPSNSNKDYNARANDVAQSVTTNAGSTPSARGGDIIVEAQALALRGREGGNMPELGGDQANALRGADGGSSAPMVLATAVRRLTPEECEKLQGFPVGWTRIPGLSGWREVGDDEDVAELEAAGLEIRRTKKSNRLRVNDPDGPRYKSLGNSFTTEPVNWIMSRVRASMAGEPMPDWQPMQLWR